METINQTRLHKAELDKLKTQVGKIRYACEQLNEPVTAEVQTWLRQFGVVVDRSYASAIVNKWRKEHDLATTGGMPVLSPELLAEIDQINAGEPEVPVVHEEPVTVAEKPIAAPERPRQEAPSRGVIVAWISFIVGGLVSVAANVAHTLYPTAAQLADWAAAGKAANDWTPPPGAMVFAAFWPIALILAVEVITRAQWRRGFLFGLARYGGTTLVAAVAAVMSYRHMSGLLAIWGEDWWGAHLGPLAVDGLMVVSAAALLSMSRAKEKAPA
ncbi:DUF2637 domain-containing protein [Actinocrispum sp. NPDC049592]|uniref:DUF2637 domain-containing protein n=1 Tax=Actinocrispum sp. NPDC049592 TaxID=3154835 RepID=UPI00343927F4